VSHRNYNDVRVEGKTIGRGMRESENRYEAIREFCGRYSRPISVLDLGAGEGYFTIRLSEDFEGVFVAIESDGRRGLLDILERNGDPNILLLESRLDFQGLKAIKSVQHFDVVLALNVVHHFNDPFQEVLDVIMSMCSYCFFEHPSGGEDLSGKNQRRVRKEPLSFEGLDPQHLLSTPWRRNSEKLRDLWLLSNRGPKTIDRRWSGGAWYPPDKRISVLSDFDHIGVNYTHRAEERDWVQGLDLRTFLEWGGSYPGREKIIGMLRDAGSEGAVDLVPNNVILTGSGLEYIDQVEWAPDYTPTSVTELVLYLDSRGWDL